MAIAVNCPNCQKPYKVPDECAGRQATCAACKKPFKVPGGNSAPAGSAPANSTPSANATVKPAVPPANSAASAKPALAVPPSNPPAAAPAKSAPAAAVPPGGPAVTRPPAVPAAKPAAPPSLPAKPAAAAPAAPAVPVSKPVAPPAVATPLAKPISAPVAPPRPQPPVAAPAPPAPAAKAPATPAAPAKSAPPVPAARPPAAAPPSRPAPAAPPPPAKPALAPSTPTPPAPVAKAPPVAPPKQPEAPPVVTSAPVAKAPPTVPPAAPKQPEAPPAVMPPAAASKAPPAAPKQPEAPPVGLPPAAAAKAQSAAPRQPEAPSAKPAKTESPASAAKPAKPPVPVAKPFAPPPDGTAQPEPIGAAAKTAAAPPEKPPDSADSDGPTIDFQCFYCDAAIKVSIALEGKQTPCPACKHIIKVPRLVKEKKKDWRSTDDGLPTGAKRETGAEPEGAWGGGTAASTVSRHALAEAGISTEPALPRTPGQKIKLALVGGAAFTLVLGLGIFVLNYLRHSQRDQALQKVDAALKSEPLTAEARANLHRGLGELYWMQANRDKALEGYQNARGSLQNYGNRTSEADVILLESALGLAELGGDKEQVRERKRFAWTAVLTEMGRSLAAQQSDDARLETLRQLAGKLVENPSADVTGLARHVTVEDQPEALAVVGLERLRAKQQEQAATLALAAHEQFSRLAMEGLKDHGPPAAPSLVALWTALKDDAKIEALKALPRDERGAFALDAGSALGLAYLGDLEQARLRVQGQRDPLDQLRGYILLGLVVLPKDPKDTVDVEKAGEIIDKLKGQLVEKMPSGKPDIPWLLYRLVAACLQAGHPDQAKKLAGAIPDAALRGRAQLAVLRSRLGHEGGQVPDSLADDVEPQAPAHLLARQAVARHNARNGGLASATVAAWEQAALRPFGYMGIALGLQDKDK